MSDPAIQPVSATIGPGAATPLAALTTAANMAPSMDELLKLYNEGFTSTLIKFAIMTLVLIGILFYVFAGGGIAEVAKNWPKYRCNPVVMPFAGFFGVDAGENFNYCMKGVFQSNAGGVLGPLYGIMSNFTDIVGVISNVANSFRYLISNLLHGMERLMGSFRDRFQFILFQIRLSFLKILSLMGRLYSTFYAVVYMGMSALRTAQNVANNDLVRFLLEFCFDPTTPISMADGTVKVLSEVAIGDKLAAVDGVEPEVTSVFRFDGRGTPMVRINSVIVSAQHYVRHNGVWIEAGQHPEAVAVASLPLLCCLNTTTHTVGIGDLVFADYDESEDPSVISRTQALVSQRLNGRGSSSSSSNTTIVESAVPRSYSLGIDGDGPITLIDGRIIKIRDVAIGDRLATRGTVLGLVQEVCSEIVIHPQSGLTIAAAQLVWEPRIGEWRRAGDLWSVVMDRPTQLYHLITSNNLIESRGIMYRDYRELTDTDMETAYADVLTGKLNSRVGAVV